MKEGLRVPLDLDRLEKPMQAFYRKWDKWRKLPMQPYIQQLWADRYEYEKCY
ncbi:MAG: hypothetical protein QW837_02520 [Conexivisphaerales archaeon]